MVRAARSTPMVAVAALAAALVVPMVDAAAADKPKPPKPPGPPSAAAQELTETTRLADRRSLVVGDRAYAMSTADTLYPAAGWHIRGEMGGVWSQPIKLVDGVWFRLADKWLGDADGARATKTTVGLGLHQDVVRAGGPGRGAAHRLRARRHPRHPGRPHPHVADGPHRAAGDGRALRADVVVPVGLDDAERRHLQPPGHRHLRQGRAAVPRATAHRRSPTRRRTTGLPWSPAAPRPKSHQLGANHRGPQDPAVVCPGRRPGADDVRRRRLRQGHRRAADVGRQAGSQQGDDAVVRRRGLGQGRQGRAARAAVGAGRPGEGVAEEDRRPAADRREHQGRAAGRPAARAEHRVEQAEPRRLGAGGARPAAAAGRGGPRVPGADGHAGQGPLVGCRLARLPVAVRHRRRVHRVRQRRDGAVRRHQGAPARPARRQRGRQRRQRQGRPRGDAGRLDLLRHARLRRQHRRDLEVPQRRRAHLAVDR